MKIRAYIRVGKDNKNKPKIDAGLRPSMIPLIKKGGYSVSDEYLATVAFAVDFEVPDSLFTQASKVIGEINVSLEKAKIAAKVEVPDSLE